MQFSTRTVSRPHTRFTVPAVGMMMLTRGWSTQPAIYPRLPHTARAGNCIDPDAIEMFLDHALSTGERVVVALGPPRSHLVRVMKDLGHADHALSVLSGPQDQVVQGKLPQLDPDPSHHPEQASGNDDGKADNSPALAGARVTRPVSSFARECGLTGSPNSRSRMRSPDLVHPRGPTRSQQGHQPSAHQPRGRRRRVHLSPPTTLPELTDPTGRIAIIGRLSPHQAARCRPAVEGATTGGRWRVRDARWSTPSSRRAAARDQR